MAVQVVKGAEAVPGGYAIDVSSKGVIVLQGGIRVLNAKRINITSGATVATNSAFPDQVDITVSGGVSWVDYIDPPAAFAIAPQTAAWVRVYIGSASLIPHGSIITLPPIAQHSTPITFVIWDNTGLAPPGTVPATGIIVEAADNVTKIDPDETQMGPPSQFILDPMGTTNGAYIERELYPCSDGNWRTIRRRY